LTPGQWWTRSVTGSLAVQTSLPMTVLAVDQIHDTGLLAGPQITPAFTAALAPGST
jgi:hypothetical protein